MASADILRAAHTSGQWRAVRDKRRAIAWRVETDLAYIADVMPCIIHGKDNDAEAAANAHLIAAAPAMLAVLKALVALPVAEKHLGYLDRGIGTATPDRAWLDAVAAIAAAEAEAGR